jgi:predicted secreted hydrolase
MRRSTASLLAAVLLLLGAAATAAAPEADGFALPEAGHPFEFPRDHGSHPDFRLEWWYVTGHLWAADGRRFGFQATFFRSAGPRPPGGSAGSPNFGTAQVYLAHVAILDVQTGTFLHQERLNREGWDASADPAGLAVTNGPWSLRMDEPAQGMHLVAGVRSEGRFALALRPTQPLVVFGQNGVSRKGASPSAASYYLTFPRLAAQGELTLGTAVLAVKGEAWMDHEISSSQLDPQQVGWDWTCLQLKDGENLMCYRMRRADGTPDPFSTLAWIDRAGHLSQVPATGFRWEVLATWHSAVTGADYPIRVRLTATRPGDRAPTAFILAPLARDQELSGDVGGIPYWEGACRVLDAAGDEAGSAFLELTGYARPLRL